jgi:hypothetical protein
VANEALGGRDRSEGARVEKCLLSLSRLYGEGVASHWPLHSIPVDA